MDMELLNAFRTIIKEELKPINERLDSMQNQIDSMQDQINSMQDQIYSVQNEVSLIKAQVEENTQILRVLEHKAEINKAEHDNFALQLANIEGNVNKIKNAVAKGEEAYNYLESFKNILTHRG
jgi:chromosome segregation ATPase